MPSISIYQDNLMEGAMVTSTGVAEGSSASYLHDNLLSFKHVTEGQNDTLIFNQPSASGTPEFKSWEYFVLADHNLAGGSLVLNAYPEVDQGGAVDNVFSQLIPDEDPFILQADAVRTNSASFSIDLQASGTVSTQSIGEMMLVTRFDSPRAPLVNVPANTRPRRTFVELNNGERRSIQHGQPARVKVFRVSGLTQAQAQLWRSEFEKNEGIKLLVLTDDEEETYMVLWNTALPRNRDLDNFTVDLEFVEVKL